MFAEYRWRVPKIQRIEIKFLSYKFSFIKKYLNKVKYIFCMFTGFIVNNNTVS